MASRRTERSGVGRSGDEEALASDQGGALSPALTDTTTFALLVVSRAIEVGTLLVLAVRTGGATSSRQVTGCDLDLRSGGHGIEPVRVPAPDRQVACPAHRAPGSWQDRFPIRSIAVRTGSVDSEADEPLAVRVEGTHRGCTRPTRAVAPLWRVRPASRPRGAAQVVPVATTGRHRPALSRPCR